MKQKASERTKNKWTTHIPTCKNLFWYHIPLRTCITWVNEIHVISWCPHWSSCKSDAWVITAEKPYWWWCHFHGETSCGPAKRRLFTHSQARIWFLSQQHEWKPQYLRSNFVICESWLGWENTWDKAAIWASPSKHKKNPKKTVTTRGSHGQNVCGDGSYMYFLHDKQEYWSVKVSVMWWFKGALSQRFDCILVNTSTLDSLRMNKL